MTKDPSSRDFTFLHILFFLGLFTIACLFGMNIYFMIRHSIQGVPFNEVEFPPMSIRVVISAGVLALLWLWVRMLSDFFRMRPCKYPVAWGWAITLGMYLGALGYFWFVYRRRIGAELRASVA